VHSLQGPQLDQVATSGHVLVLHDLASLRSPGQVDPSEHERYRSDLPLPQLLVQLVQDPQLDQVTSAGQLLGLQSLSALMTPEQPTPPGQLLPLLDFPPPQLLLQLLQDSQFDH